MILIVLVLLIVGVGASVILLIQNWSPVLPLIVLGQTTVELPLALWILSAVLAGVVTSVVLQGLSYLAGSGRANSPPRRRSGGSQPPVSPRPPRRNQRQPEERRPPQPKQMVSEWELEDDLWVEEEEEMVNEQQRQPEPPETPEEREWTAKKKEEDWNLDKPPLEATIPALKRKISEKFEEAVNLESLRDQAASQGSRRVAEYQRRKQQRQPSPSQPPKRVTQSNSEIYDAQYRVIKPPQSPPEVPQDEDNEEEDWI